MDEYINKQAVLRDWHSFDEPADVFQYIKDFPAADVKPVVRGKWVRNNGRWCCDKCTCQAVVIRSPFCPNCGADMRGGDAE